LSLLINHHSDKFDVFFSKMLWKRQRRVGQTNPVTSLGKNKDGKTPLMIAATMGLTDIATILVDNGAD
jgi:hypothetical protein